MSPSAFVIVLLLGATVLACWTYVRFPRLAPKTAAASLVHLLLSGVAAQLALPTGLGVLGPVDSRTTALVLVALALPALTYLMLASIWLLQLARQLLGGYNR